MKKIFILLLISIIITSCNVKKNISHHGIHQLKEKNELLKIGKSNKNDIIDILGPPSVISTFDNDLFFYIERKTVTQSVIKLGQRKLLVNNVLVVELDNRGLLLDKSFYDLNEMNELKIISNKTEVDYQKSSFIYDFLSSMRQKVNDPLGKRNRD
tara:strand:+ start:5121 stop:5585 length:465 start_codon:yes stop_codon:yes gene_type:complete